MRRAGLVAGACVLVLAGCGTTVPLASQGQSQGLGAGANGLAQPTVGPGGVVATGGAAPGSLPIGASAGPGVLATEAADGGGTGALGSDGSAGHATSTSGFGWDAKNVYVGVPTADDFAALTKQAGANFDNGDVHGDFNAIAADINARGGILGRKLVIVYHDAPTAQYSSNGSVVAQSMCTYFTQDRPVVAVVNGAPQLDAQPNFHTCLEKKKVTLLTLTDTDYNDKDYARLGPHLLSAASMSTDILVPTFIAALKRMGYFSGWDTTLGGPASTPAAVGLLLPDDAAGHSVGALFKAQLKRAGEHFAAEYYYPPSGSGSESQSEVLAFTSAKVTHVLNLPPVELEIALFQRQAENQHYRPRYGYTPFDLPLTVEENPAVAPPAQQAGSMGIGWQPLNDVNATKDVGDMPGGKRCFSALRAGGQTFDTSHRRAKFAGSLVCDAMYLLRDAFVAAGGLSGDALLRALPQVGPRFTPASTFRSILSGTDHGIPGYYRDSAYDSGCSCFAYRGANRPFGR